jgi:hypothetical protein
MKPEAYARELAERTLRNATPAEMDAIVADFERYLGTVAAADARMRAMAALLADGGMAQHEEAKDYARAVEAAKNKDMEPEEPKPDDVQPL